jgi:DNA-binding MarR family transcriptional regulator
MSDTKLESQSLEIVSLWEDAVCLHAYQKSLIPADLMRAKKRLAKLSSQSKARHSSDRPFLFYRVCVILARHGGSAAMGELSAMLGVPLSTATRLVNQLGNGGFVERRIDPKDHRIVHIVLTDDGKQLYQTIHDFAQRRAQAALVHFTIQERKQLVALLQKMSVALANLPL